MKEKMNGRCIAVPFDDTAPNRLKHMGLLDGEGNIMKTSMAVLGRIMAGLYFDGLCDYYNEVSGVLGVYEDMRGYLECHDYRSLLLRYSLQYDLMHESLPPAVWWLSGNKGAVNAFLENLMKELTALVADLSPMSEQGEAIR